MKKMTVVQTAAAMVGLRQVGGGGHNVNLSIRNLRQNEPAPAMYGVAHGPTPKP